MKIKIRFVWTPMKTSLICSTLPQNAIKYISNRVSPRLWLSMSKDQITLNPVLNYRLEKTKMKIESKSKRLIFRKKLKKKRLKLMSLKFRLNLAKRQKQWRSKKISFLKNSNKKSKLKCPKRNLSHKKVAQNSRLSEMSPSKCWKFLKLLKFLLKILPKERLILLK